MGFFGSRSSNEQAKDSNRERQRETSKYTKVSKKAKAKVQTDRDNDSRDKLTNYQLPKVKSVGVLPIILNAAQKFRQKTFEVNRDYFRKNVVGKNNYKDTFESYEKYIKGRSGGNLDAMGRNINTPGGGRDNPQGIELAKSSTGSATVKGPGEIQKDAANNKGTTDNTMTAAQINVANKRKGKKVTNQTAKKVLTEDYKLSKKILLG